MKIKIALYLGVLIFVSPVFAQSITTKNVEIVDTDTTIVEGVAEFRGGLRVVGLNADGGGRLILSSESPRLNFSESDNTDSRFTLLNAGGRLTYKRYDGDWTLIDDPIEVGRPGEGTTVSGGLTHKDGFLAFPQGTTVNINGSGAVSVDNSHHILDTYQSAASSDLRNINFAGDPVDGAIIYLRTLNGARDVVIKHNDGNIRVNDGGDLTLNTTQKIAMLMYMLNLDRWVVINAW
ncbi:MAG: hypothetical protein R8G66_10020 [Cytophagales bacterium]|nr:hypothetical protein [Cytophagales bacterium]